ncbi:putative polygalacturonase, partial [Trifolium medium]|nr:putative polygalacturonase [Trifolium medium]
DEKYWPLMPPLPSYGYGRERPGPRYGSLIHGQNLKDVVITGIYLAIQSKWCILRIKKEYQHINS